MQCLENSAVETIENVIRGGGNLVSGWQMARKQEEFDGSTNCRQLINGLLIKENILDSATQIDRSGEGENLAPNQMAVAEDCATWNEILIMAAQGGGGDVELRKLIHANFNWQVVRFR